MPDEVEDDVASTMRAVRAAYDDLQVFRAIHRLQIPSSLSSVVKALDKLSAKLNVLTDSSEALSIFRGYTLKQKGNFVETALSDAIIRDMKATATYFRTMKPTSFSEMPTALDEPVCQNIKEMVDRYETLISIMLSKHKECVRIESNLCTHLSLIHSRSRLSSLTIQGRELREGIDGIRRRLTEQQDSELADIRTSELLSAPVSVGSSLSPPKRNP
jgi:hypothetical protein